MNLECGCCHQSVLLRLVEAAEGVIGQIRLVLAVLAAGRGESGVLEGGQVGEPRCQQLFLGTGEGGHQFTFLPGHSFAEQRCVAVLSSFCSPRKTLTICKSSASASRSSTTDAMASDIVRAATTCVTNSSVDR